MLESGRTWLGADGARLGRVGEGEMDPRDGPDWPDALAESIGKLGAPTDVFRISHKQIARRTFSGILLIVGGAIANYLYWGVFNGPADFHIVHFLLISPILTGIGFLYAAWRDRGLWVLAYPMGLLRWQRGEVVTFPWDEVAEIFFYRVVECERPRRSKGPDGRIVTSWLPIAKMGSRTLGAHLTLRRLDGVQSILPSSLTEFTRLCRLVQEESFRSLWPNASARFLAGDPVAFGEISLSLAGIHREGSFLPWHELDDALVLNGKLVIRSRVHRRPWLDLPLHNVMNPHLFVAMLIMGPALIKEKMR
jgi:hypothetical protein